MAEGGEMTFLGRSDRGVVCRSIAVIINIKYECLRICANATFLLFVYLRLCHLWQGWKMCLAIHWAFWAKFVLFYFG